MLRACDTVFANVAASGIITRQPSFLCCVIFTATDAGDYVDLYEGRDATSGRKVFRMKALANRSQSFNFTEPVLCERGIYISFSATDTEATVVFIPVEHEDIRRSLDQSGQEKSLAEYAETVAP